MLKVRRTIVRKKIRRECTTRGPYLTESHERDGGWRRIVVVLHPDHLVLRHFRRGRSYPLTYEKAIAVARRDAPKEIRSLKRRGVAP